MSDIFVSHAHQDNEIARTLVCSIEKHGSSCWLALRDIDPGANYADEIINAIKRSKLLVVLVSAEAMLSPHVQREVERAVKLKKTIIPILFPAIQLSGPLDYFLATTHCISIKQPTKDSILEIADQIAGKIDSEGALTNRAPKRRTRLAILSLVIAISIAGALLWKQFGPPSQDRSNNSVAVSVPQTSEYKNLAESQNPDVIPTLSNLASLKEAMGQYQEAIEIYRRVVSISEKSYGSDHPKFGDALLTLAMAYGNTEQATKGIEPARQALEIYRRTYGAEHPRTASSLNNLATLLIKEGNFVEATPLVEEALRIRRSMLGPDGPDLIPVYENLVILSERSGEFDKAKQYRERIAEQKKRD